MKMLPINLLLQGADCPQSAPFLPLTLRLVRRATQRWPDLDREALLVSALLALRVATTFAPVTRHDVRRVVAQWLRDAAADLQADARSRRVRA